MWSIYDPAAAAFPTTPRLSAWPPHLAPPLLLRPPCASLLAQVVYERAVATFPVTQYLWAQYGRFVEAHLRINSGADAASEWAGRQTRGRAGRAVACEAKV